jgi:ABC-type uncharacterized transport system auxiliary subunit
MMPTAFSARRISEVLLVLLAAGIAAACGSSRPMKYYTLDVTPEPRQASAPKFPLTLLVARVAGSHLYRDDRLVYGMSPEELETYEYHRWAEPPVDMIQDSLIESLRATGDFRSVSAVASNLRGDYLLRSRLDAFEEIDKPQLAARFTIQLELFDPKSGATVWNGSYSHDQPVSGKKVDDVIAALDENVKAGMSQIASDLGQYFAALPPAK